VSRVVDAPSPKGHARSTPHDGYFYEKPAEMIAGEVPAPSIGLGNRDVTLRHLHATVFGAGACRARSTLAARWICKGSRGTQTW